jgi:hypothetical protein
VLELGEDLLDGVQVRRIFWQEEELCADRAYKEPAIVVCNGPLYVTVGYAQRKKTAKRRISGYGTRMAPAN